jgi:hypothetical protein
VLASLAAAGRFPPAQRLFVLFLEAADSHRLNAHLMQCGLSTPACAHSVPSMRTHALKLTAARLLPAMRLEETAL